MVQNIFSYSKRTSIFTGHVRSLTQTIFYHSSPKGLISNTNKQFVNKESSLTNNNFSQPNLSVFRDFGIYLFPKKLIFNVKNHFKFCSKPIKLIKYCSTASTQLNEDNESKSYLESIINSDNDGKNIKLQIDDHVFKSVTKETSRELASVRPALVTKSSSLAPYVNESDSLKELVKLGVDLSIVERNTDVSNKLLQCEFENDIKPYLLFLCTNKVSNESLGKCISKNPDILLTPVKSMENNINYFKSKNIESDAIGRIISLEPKTLTRPVEEIDKHLGILQKEFRLSGPDLRLAITKKPKLILYNKTYIHKLRMIFNGVMGFSKEEQCKILIAHPRLFLSSENALISTFDYLHNTMGLSHQQILTWPNILDTRSFILKRRHQFLEKIGRDQFDPTKPRFVSLKDLVTGRDRDFCRNVCKVSLKEYSQFLKTK